MSEHAWTLENVAAFVAGGLDAAEAERLERHAAECAECAAALRSARALDLGLDGLFAIDRPGPALEDRMIRSLRTESASAVLRSRWRRKLAWGAAAAVALGATGAGMSRLVGDELPFPGMPLASRLMGEADQERVYRETDSLKQLSLATHNANDDAPLGADWGDGSVRLTRDMYGEIRDPEQMARAIAEQFRGSTSNTVVLDDTHSMRDRRASSLPAGGQVASETEAIRRSAEMFAPRDVQTIKAHKEKAEQHFLPEELLKQHKEPAAGEISDLEEKRKENDGERKSGGKGQGKSDQEGQPKSQGRDVDGGQPKPPPGPDKVEQPKPEVPAPEPAPARKVIRTGEIEFEVESFDSALATVTKLVLGIKGGFVATINSDKLANG